MSKSTVYAKLFPLMLFLSNYGVGDSRTRKNGPLILSKKCKIRCEMKFRSYLVKSSSFTDKEHEAQIVQCRIHIAWVHLLQIKGI